MRWLLVFVLACSKPAVPDYPPMEAAELHALLASRERAVEIDRVRVEPEAGGLARYVVTMRASPRKRAAMAAFPGTLVDELFVAGVLYNVKPAGEEYEERAKEIDAGSLRTLLEDPEAVAGLESIRVKPTAPGAARYLLRKKASSVPDVVFAEYPGTIIPAIQAAGIPLSTE